MHALHLQKYLHYGLDNAITGAINLQKLLHHVLDNIIMTVNLIL